MPDEEANIFKVRYLHGRHGRKWGGHKREGGCALAGEVCQPAMSYRHRSCVCQVLQIGQAYRLLVISWR